MDNGRFDFFQPDLLSGKYTRGDGCQGGAIEHNDYYPYGMLFGTSVGKDSKQPFKFGGKEYISAKGFNTYDFGARGMDGSNPVWTSVDQMAEKYPHISPYVYCANNPTRYADPDGRDIWDFLGGVIHSIGSNLSLGTIPTNTDFVSNTTDYNTGRNVGDVISIVMGATETAMGATVAAGGGVATVGTAGAAAPVAIPISVAGVATTLHGTGTAGTAIKSLATQEGRISQLSGDTRTAKDPLRKDKNGNPKPDPEAEGSNHTQLGQKDGKKGTYKQAREFNKNNSPEKDIDFTDHGRPKNHQNPHQHRYKNNSTGGTKQRGEPEPLEY